MARRNGRRPQHVAGSRPDDARTPSAQGRARAVRDADEGLDLFDGDGEGLPAAAPPDALHESAGATASRRSSPAVAADPFGPPASVLAPRVAMASWATAFVASVLGSLAVVAYTDATDPQPVDAGTWVGDLARTAGVGGLVGLGVGALVALLTTWAAMALRRQLAGPLLRSRLLALLGAVLFWALTVSLLLHLVGFGGLGTLGFAAGLPGLLVALLLAWVLTPWALRGVRVDPSGV